MRERKQPKTEDTLETLMRDFLFEAASKDAETFAVVGNDEMIRYNQIREEPRKVIAEKEKK